MNTSDEPKGSGVQAPDGSTERRIEALMHLADEYALARADSTARDQYAIERRTLREALAAEVSRHTAVPDEPLKSKDHLSEQPSVDRCVPPDGSALGFYVGGPFPDGAFAVCETATGRAVRVFRGEEDLHGPQLYKWSYVGLERYRRMAAGPDDADADASPAAAVHQQHSEPDGFDKWAANPYTKVLEESIKRDYVPKESREIREALARLVELLDAEMWNWRALHEAGEAARSALALHACHSD